MTHRKPKPHIRHGLIALAIGLTANLAVAWTISARSTIGGGEPRLLGSIERPVGGGGAGAAGGGTGSGWLAYSAWSEPGEQRVFWFDAGSVKPSEDIWEPDRQPPSWSGSTPLPRRGEGDGPIYMVETVVGWPMPSLGWSASRTADGPWQAASAIPLGDFADAGPASIARIRGLPLVPRWRDLLLNVAVYGFAAWFLMRSILDFTGVLKRRAAARAA